MSRTSILRSAIKQTPAMERVTCRTRKVGGLSFSFAPFYWSFSLWDEPSCPLLDVVGKPPKKNWVSMTPNNSMVTVITEESSDFSCDVVMVHCESGLELRMVL